MAESFATTSRYLDNKHYPCGFSRHDDFTVREVQLLERHGYAFSELDLSKHEPVTEGEKLFMAVCRSKREPATGTERVWFECMTRIKRLKRFYILSGGRPRVEGAGDYTDSDD